MYFNLMNKFINLISLILILLISEAALAAINNNSEFKAFIKDKVHEKNQVFSSVFKHNSKS